MSDSAMQTLFSRIKTHGVKPSFVRRALPSWWDDTIASSEAGLQQAQLYIAKQALRASCIGVPIQS